MLSQTSAAAAQLSPSALARHGHQLAVLHRGVPVTYVELAAKVRRRATELGDPQQLLTLYARNDLDSLLWYLAALANGNPVLMLAGSNKTHNRDILETYHPELIAQGANLTSAGPAGPPGTDPAGPVLAPGAKRPPHPDLALLLTTSGSTGSPKLVRLSHTNLLANAAAIAETLQIRSSDRAITTLPMAYSYGLSVINSHLVSGAGLVLCEYSVVDACFWDLVTQAGVTSFAGVPYTYELLEQVDFADRELPNLQYITQAGGRMHPDRVRAWAALGQSRGWDFHVMYGQTEATARMTHLPPDLAHTHADAVGYAIPGGTLSLDPQSSELCYRGPNVMMGYATQSSDLALGPTESTLRTGDLGEIAPDGLIRIVGRLARFAKVCGLRVDLDRFESEIQDGLGGDAECAAVATDAGITLCVADPTRSAMQTRLDCTRLTTEHFGLPATALRVIRVTELPRGSNGKLDRGALLEIDSRAVQADQKEQPDGAGGRSATLLELYRHSLARPDATAQDTFVGLGGDSLSYVAVSSHLNARLPRVLQDWPQRTIAELQSHIRSQQTKAAADPSSVKRWWQVHETSVVLRALAILAVVGSHIGTYDIRGGAHLLIALAGFSYARFILVTQHDRITRARSLIGSIRRIAIPSLAWLALLVLFSSEYGPTVLLVNSWAGATESTPEWRYWFIEAIIVTLLLAWLLTRSRWFDALERRQPLLLPLVLATGAWSLALATRAPLDQPAALYAPVAIVWLFAMGWAAARCKGHIDRLVVSACLLIGAAAFFGFSGRFLAVGAGFLLLVWVDRLPLPRGVPRVLSAIAAASLLIYLTHYQVYPLFADRLWLALGAAILTGIVVHEISLRLRTARHGRATVPAQMPQRAQDPPAESYESGPSKHGGTLTAPRLGFRPQHSRRGRSWRSPGPLKRLLTS